MKEYIRKVEKNSILISVLLIILALCLILKPAELIVILIRFFGVILVGLGIFHMISYFSIGKEFELFQYNLIEGIAEICFGIFCILRTNIIQGVFPIVIGVWIIVQGMLKFQLAFNLKNLEEEKWGGVLVSAVMSLILGMIIICDPFASSIAITTIGGIVLLLSEIVSIAESIWVLSNIK